MRVQRGRSAQAGRSRFRRIEEYLRAREIAAERIGLGVALVLAVSSFSFASHVIGTSTGRADVASFLPSLSSGVPLNRSLAAARVEPEVTGSVRDSSEMMRKVRELRSASLGEAHSGAISHDYVVRKVQHGTAFVEGPTGMHQVVPGAILAGVGRIMSIEKSEAGWIVVTTETTIAERSI